MNTMKSTGDRVLVVDDDFTICEFLSNILKNEGYRPIVFTHPHDALAAFEEKALSLAFIDINLPEINGLELAKKLRQKDPRLEVVFITGYGTFDNAIQAIRIGAYDYLRKPFTFSEFSLCLKRYEERKALREQIRLAEQRYFYLVQNSPLLIFVLLKDFQMEFVNQACLNILGYSPDEAVNTPDWFLNRIYSEDRQRIDSLFRSAFESRGVPFSTECRLLHKKGHLIYAILRSIPPLQHESGHEVEQLEGIIVDITDRVLLERTLIQREKLETLGTISAEVAHEIRNPLVSIGGFARRIQKKNPDLPEIDIILRESRRLETLLDRIKNYLKPVEVRRQECSVNSVVKKSVDFLSPEMEYNGVTCRMAPDSAISTAYVDKEILMQVCINLIRNAVAILDKGSVLFIRLYESGESVHVDFKNKMVENKIRDPRLLFLPFDDSGQTFGLPLCYRLLKNMGGLLSFSQEEDHVIFTVTLPKYSPVTQACLV
jgi:two-component system sensor histidine kinase HydH